MVIEKTAPALRQRNYGIDCLRILSMFMIVLLHVLGPGGVLAGTELFSVNFHVAWIVEIAAFCAVNCYGIISGYVGCDSKYKYTNLIMIYLQVVSYALPITLILHFKAPDIITGVYFKNALLPISMSQYWYLTAYAGLFVLMPVLNKSISFLTKKQLGAVLIGGFVAFSVLPTYFRLDIFRGAWGYSLLWLMFLYLAGGYVKKHGLPIKNSWILFAIYLGNTLISYALKLLEISNFPTNAYTDPRGGYASPFMLLSGLCLFAIFEKVSPGNFGKKLISILSPCAFGVYIIHAHPLMWDRLITSKYAAFSAYPAVFMVLAVAGAALGMYIALSLVDFVRLQIFNALKIKKLLSRAEEKLLGNLWQE